MNPDKKPLGPWFWIILFSPAVFILMTINTAMNSNGAEGIGVGIAALVLALVAAFYCGFRLGFYWLKDKVAASTVSVLISLGLLAAYAAVFFFGCLATLELH